jgi:hypothetical protein
LEVTLDKNGMLPKLRFGQHLFFLLAELKSLPTKKKGTGESRRRVLDYNPL